MFAFDSPSWAKCELTSFVLQEVVRQQGDLTFIKMLNELRVGVCSPATLAALACCRSDRKPKPLDGILPTKLYCTNVNVDVENTKRLAALPGVFSVFNAADQVKGGGDSRQVQDMLNKKISQKLELKVGAQVVMILNRRGLVNGSRGVVVGFNVAKVTNR